jgi:tetraacyldisaccharide 4'-kinase
VIINLRNYLFDKGFLKTTKVDAKVISIGNLTVGGSGKTPAVIAVTKLLQKLGKKPGILSRGYGRNTKGYLLVSNEETLLVSVDQSSDEMYMAASDCKVPSAVCERRVEGAKRFLKETDIDTIILDDAYQHRWIKRDLNILMMDQRFLHQTGSIKQKPLPLGNMREGFASINRADVIVINRKFNNKREIPAKLSKYFEGKKVIHCFYKTTGIYDLKTNEHFTLNEFEGQKSLIVCGIAKPFSFLKVLEENRINFSNKLLFRDHQKYSNKEVQLIRKQFYSTNSHSVLTTQKDAVKLSKYSNELDDIDIYYLKIEIDFEEGENFYNHIKRIYEH